MRNVKGKTALVTGASSGIGKAFAELLARKGAHVIVTARSKPELDALAAALTGPKLGGATAIALDLGEPGAAQKLFDAVKAKGLSVDLLVNNAGFGKWGDFLSVDAAVDAQMIQLNVTALVDLCHLFLPGMLERGDGGIINVASTAAFAPLGWAAVYSATKAFVLSFSEALFVECQGRGVHVMCLCPGATRSNFAAVAGGVSGGGMGATAQSVAATGLRGFLVGRSFVIPGAINNVFSWIPRLMPRRGAARFLGRAWKGIIDRRGTA